MFVFLCTDFMSHEVRSDWDRFRVSIVAGETSVRLDPNLDPNGWHTGTRPLKRRLAESEEQTCYPIVIADGLSRHRR